MRDYSKNQLNRLFSALGIHMFLIFLILGSSLPPQNEKNKKLCSMTGPIVMLPEACN